MIRAPITKAARKDPRMEKETVKAEILKRFSKFQHLPYLFIGAGFSMRYSDSPNWNDLLQSLWRDAHPDKDELEFKLLRGRIENNILKQQSDIPENEKRFWVNPEIASVIEQDFNASFYNNESAVIDLFKSDELHKILDGNLSPFKFHIAKKLSQTRIDPSKEHYPEISSLEKNHNKVAGVITTNYDNILNGIFRDFQTMIGQDNLLLSNALNIFEIYKIHGSCSDPSSIVLTKEDYEHFDNKLKYLSAKLLTIFVENPVIFIGYNIGDINIRKLLQEIANCLNREQLSLIKDNLIFISRSRDGNNEIGKRTVEFNTGTLEMTEFILEDFSDLYECFCEIKNSVPVKLARQLQDMVSDYVYSVEAKNTVIFGDINSPDIDDSQVALYFGKKDAISSVGFDNFTLEDMLEDILFDNKPYLMNELLLTRTLWNIRMINKKTYLPIYKYISGLNYSIENISDDFMIIDNIDNSDDFLDSNDRHYTKENLTFDNIADIKKHFEGHFYRQVSYIKKCAKNLPTEEIGDFLREHFNEVFKAGEKENFKTNFRKLIAIYDFKKYMLLTKKA